MNHAAKTSKPGKTKRYSVYLTRAVLRRHLEGARVEVAARSPAQAKDKAEQLADQDIDEEIDWCEEEAIEEEVEDLEAIDAKLIDDDLPRTGL
jgi:hypothetical protein